jgi:hypothetical protein
VSSVVDGFASQEGRRVFMPIGLREGKGDGHCDQTCCGWDVCNCFIGWVTCAFFTFFTVIVLTQWITWED